MSRTRRIVTGGVMSVKQIPYCKQLAHAHEMAAHFHMGGHCFYRILEVAKMRQSSQLEITQTVRLFASFQASAQAAFLLTLLALFLANLLFLRPRGALER